MRDFKFFSFFFISATFNVTVTRFCNSQLSLENRISLLGDGDLICENDFVNIPVPGEIVYTSPQTIGEKTDIEVQLYTKDKMENCDNVTVYLRKIDGKIQLCRLIERLDKLCQYLCTGQFYNQVVIRPNENNIKFCEILLKSQTKLINVCI